MTNKKRNADREDFLAVVKEVGVRTERSVVLDVDAADRGVALDGTPFASLPSFGAKLRKAVRRHRASDTNEIVLWPIEREEAEAGYTYLMAFSHENAPEYFLPNGQMDAFQNVALAVMESLMAEKGPKELV